MSLSLGLIPICRGTFEGTVFDADTDLPIPFAVIAASTLVTADTNGRYIMTNVPLGSNNADRGYGMSAEAEGYWFASEVGVAKCGIVTPVDFHAVLHEFGSVKGRVVEGAPNLFDPNFSVSPTDIPVEGARVSTLNNIETDVAGIYQDDQLFLNYNNAPRTTTTLNTTNAGF